MKLSTVKPVAYRSKPKNFLSNTVTKPTRPKVAKNAKARGTPAKLEATPENVIKVGLIQGGSLP